MVKVEVMKAESPAKKFEEDSQEELKEQPGERDKESDNEEHEIPLEKMTKKQLLKKVKGLQ